MPTDLRVRASKRQTVQEDVSAAIRELTLQVPTPTQPGVLSIVVQAQDAAGEWRTDLDPRLLRRVDNPQGATPAERNAANRALDVIFTAIISDTAQHRNAGVAGLTVLEGLKVLLAAQIAAEGS